LGESSVDQGIDQLSLAAKVQFAVRDHDFTGGGEHIVTLEADAAIAYTD